MISKCADFAMETTAMEDLMVELDQKVPSPAYP